MFSFNHLADISIQMDSSLNTTEQLKVFPKSDSVSVSGFKLPTFRSVA